MTNLRSFCCLPDNPPCQGSIIIPFCTNLSSRWSADCWSFLEYTIVREECQKMLAILWSFSKPQNFLPPFFQKWDHYWGKQILHKLSITPVHQQLICHIMERCKKKSGSFNCINLFCVNCPELHWWCCSNLSFYLSDQYGLWTVIVIGTARYEIEVDLSELGV